jgi:hypothetical protein
MADILTEKDGIKMSVATEINAWALLNVLDIFRFVMCATDDEIVERYGTEGRAVDIAEKCLNIAMKAAILEQPLSGWKMKYSQPTKGNPDKRVMHEACFYNKTEVDDNG